MINTKYNSIKILVTDFNFETGIYKKTTICKTSFNMQREVMSIHI